METQQQPTLKTKTPMDAKQRQTGNNNENLIFLLQINESINKQINL
jgi:hypothetical protein